MSLYPVNSCIKQSVSVLYFCYETECTVTTLFREEQNTLRILCNVFCIIFAFFTIVKLGSVARLIFYLQLGDIPSD